MILIPEQVRSRGLVHVRTCKIFLESTPFVNEQNLNYSERGEGSPGNTGWEELCFGLMELGSLLMIASTLVSPTRPHSFEAVIPSGPSLFWSHPRTTGPISKNLLQHHRCKDRCKAQRSHDQVFPNRPTHHQLPNGPRLGSNAHV
eukprot:g33825.t1